jgi:L-tyrosine isonitrile synthase
MLKFNPSVFAKITVLSLSFPFCLSTHSRSTPVSLIHVQVSAQSIKIAETIYQIFKKHQVSESGTLAESRIVGQKEFIQHLAQFIERNEPIQMLLPGFPFKSANHEKKVLGALPDMAERKSLVYLQEIANQIEQVYVPGIHITIFCDGIVFGELLGISEQVIQDYERALEKLCQDLPSLTVVTTQKLQQKLRLKKVLEVSAYLDQFSPSNAEMKAQLASNSKVQDSFHNLQARLALEFDHSQGYKALRQYSNGLSEVAFLLMAREARLRTAMKELFPHQQFVRLTVHPSQDISQKFGIKLSPDSSITPYHGVCVDEGNGHWTIQFSKDVSRSDYQEVTQVIHGVACHYLKRN